MDKNKHKKVSQSFAAGAFIMALGMLVVKIAGAAFKIPLTYILGGVGSGYFNSAYSIYNPIYALATAGLPIAISRMVAGDMARGRYKDVKLIHKMSIPIFVSTGLIGSVVMIALSFAYANFTNAPGSLFSIFMLAPTVFFSCLISIYKGYYEGLRNMIPTAVSEVVEAMGKVVFGIGMAIVALNYSMNEYKNFGTVLGQPYENEALARNAALPLVSAGAVFGITLGAIAGFLYMYFKYKMCGDGITEEELEKSEEARPAKKLMSMILKISIPIALGAIVMNLSGAIDAALVQRRLDDIMRFAPDILLRDYSGLISPEVISEGTVHIFLAGCFGYMNNITMILPTITQGLAISALPNVTAAWVSGLKETIQKNIEKILKITSIISFPAGLGMSVMAYPIMDLIYNTGGRNQQLGEICISSQIMSLYALGIMLAAISTPICSMLQAVGRADITLKILTVGVIIKVCLNYILVGIPEINIQGAGAGTLVCYIFICTMGLVALCRETKTSVNLIKIFFKPLSCGLFCAASAYYSHNLMIRVLPYKLSTVISIGLAAVVYALILLLSRTVTSADLIAIPKCKKIVKTLEKYHLMY